MFFKDNIFECVAEHISVSRADIHEKPQKEFESCQYELLNIIAVTIQFTLWNWAHETIFGL
jgi:hypothetical protein